MDHNKGGKTMIRRAFLYGDLLFETIRVQEGKIAFAQRHYNRLLRSAAILKMDTSGLTEQLFCESILAAAAGISHARVRFTLYRDSDGFYTPEKNDVAFEVDCFALAGHEQVCNNLGVFDAYTKACSPLSNLKSGNALLSVMSGMHAKENGFDECVMLNQHNRVCETISTNIFLVRDNTLHTPPLSEGCVDGVMREVVLEVAAKKGFQVLERELSLAELATADEIFLTSAIRGIVPVRAYAGKQYGLTVAERLQQLCTIYSQ